MSQLDAAYNPVDILNEVRSMELQAISQYMGHHYVLEDIDMPELAKAVKKYPSTKCATPKCWASASWNWVARRYVCPMA